MKKVILFIAIILITAGVGFGMYHIISNATEPEEMISVAVLTNDVQEGAFLTTDDYYYKPIAKSDYIASYVTMQKREIVNEATGQIVVETFDSLKGKEVKSPMYEGERINKSRIRFDNEMTEEMELTNANYKRYTYDGAGLNNFAGLLKSGDRVDIWLQYTISAKEDKANKQKEDKIIVTEKIFSDVLISRVLDESGSEVTTSSGGASILEFMLTEADIQKFLSWRAIGTVTLVKSNSVQNEDEVTRKVISMNELISEVVNDKENNSLLNPNADYVIDTTENDFTEKTL